MSKSLVFTFLAIFILAATAFGQPAVPAPTPTEPAGEVTSLFSNAYTDVTVDTWSAVWDAADVADVQIMGNDTKEYTNLVFAGIEFTSNVLDVSGHTHFHMDMWTGDPTIDPNQFRIKLVDFGPDGVWGNDDSEHEIVFNEFTDPALVTGSWIEFDIPLDDFAGLTNLTSMAQLILQSDPGPNTVYIDNVYFSGVDGGGEDPEPQVAAPTPTEPANQVISLFSNAYTNVPVDTWSAGWDAANVEDVQVVGDDTKLYTGFIFAGVEFTSQVIDVTDYQFFHMDYWTPDPIDVGDIFKIKLVDFGPDGVWGNDDSEHELVFDANTNPGLVSEQWVSFDIPMSDFAGLTNHTSMAQMVMVSDPGPNTIYIDNVYFHTLPIQPDPVEVTMTPVGGTTIPQGGVLFFDISVTNNTPNTGHGRLYTEAILPSSNTYGPIIDVTGLTIPGEHTFNFTGIGQSIPGGAPLGMYTYVCRVQYAGGGMAVSGFEFEVVPGAATALNGWNVFGTKQIDNAIAGEASSELLPTESAMMAAYPNPFNPTTTVQLTLPQAAELNVVVHNSLGQNVATLASGPMNAGTHALTFDGSNLASGLYFVQATVAGKPLGVQKLMLLK
jgi:Secretion system C-terminal sorting domain